jgi:hypothetical protein
MHIRIRPVVLALTWTCGLSAAHGQVHPGPTDQRPDPAVVDRARDRGTGVSTSMFATYIRRGELLVYPFFEYYRDRDTEYQPAELGYAGEQEFRGRYRASELLVFVGYGLTDNLAVEFETAVIKAALNKAAEDRSGLPPRLEEAGLGDMEGQVRWRWQRETERRPELFSYAEVVVPHASDRPLTGTPGWEIKVGTGLTRAFRWGTLTVRGAAEYDEASSSHFDLGEYALEYVRRLSPRWRVYAGIEGTQDEVELIGEIQWHLTPRIALKINNGLGLTSKATDWAPEVGLIVTFPGPRSRPARP